MENNLQKRAFATYEADAYFERNKGFISSYSANEDGVINILKEYDIMPKSLLEIGCSAGYRLNGIKKTFPDCEVFGVEPSQKAIKYGEKNFSDVKFHLGTADDLTVYKNGSMDVVIVGFVFYVIDRSIVLKVVSEIDRVLKNGGVLIVVDFFSETSLKNAYQHIKDFTAYSFKQNYDEIFTSSRLYHLLDKTTLNHHNRKLDATGDHSNKYCISLLRKDLNASYK